MAVTCANLTSGTDTSDGSTATTASVTLVANRLYIFTVRSRTGISTTPNTPTLAITGATIDNIAAINTDIGGSSRQKESVFRTMVSSNVTGTIGIDFGGQTQTAISWVIDEVQGIDTTGSNGAGAVLEVKTTVNTSTPATSITATLTDTSANAVYGAYGAGNASANNPVVGSGFTEIKKLLESTEDSSTILTEFKASFDATVDVTFDSDYELGIVAIGLKEAGGTTYNKSIVDSIGITDIRTRVVTSNRSLVDPLGITDILAKALTANRVLVDSLGLTDILSASRILSRSQVDVIGITDTINTSVQLTRSIVDALGITDTNAYARILDAVLTDSIGLSDTLSRTTSLLRTQQDSIGLADTLSSVTALSRSIVDSMTLADVLSGSFIISASLVDSMGVTDTITKTINYTRSNVDSMGVSDVINTTAQIFSALVDSIGLVDNLDRTSLMFVALVDSEGVVDVLNYTATQGVTERDIIDAVGVTDTLTAYLIFRKPSVVRLESVEDIRGILESVRNK